MELISIILSFRNEADLIPEMIRRLQASLDSASVNHEIIYVNDDSTDNSLEVLKSFTTQDERIKVINMSRRFGVYECMLAGMKYAQGDAVVYLDADLQDPPEVIPALIAKWREGADVVYTVREKREGESFIKLFLTRIAYTIINAVSEITLPVEAGDFRLLSRRVVNILLQFNESNPYMRGLITWVGFKQERVYYTRHKRAAGISNFPIFRSVGPIAVFTYGFTSFSSIPLVFFLVLGLTITGASAIAFLLLFVLQIVRQPINSNVWLADALFFTSGIQIMGIGTLGIYLARVFKDVRRRPHYIVGNTINVDKSETTHND